MAGTIKAMNLIKQVLQLKELGESNRGIARKLPIDKETVNRYMQILSANGWKIPELLKVDDPEWSGWRDRLSTTSKRLLMTDIIGSLLFWRVSCPSPTGTMLFQSELIAEACLDRLVHKATRFELKGESLRKKY